jgi:hypothetical protein
MCQPQPLTLCFCSYIERFEYLTQDFCARFSDVNSIYQQVRMHFLLPFI